MDTRRQVAQPAETLQRQTPLATTLLEQLNHWIAPQTYTGRVLIHGGGLVTLADPTRFSVYAQNTVSKAWIEAMRVDNSGDDNVVAMFPKFLSMGTLGVSGIIEFGPDAGAEAVILGSGSPNFHLISRVSKQANSVLINGVHTTGGAWQLARSTDNFVANSENFVQFRASGIQSFYRNNAVNATIRAEQGTTDGALVAGDILHDLVYDGNTNLNYRVGLLFNAITGSPGTTTNRMTLSNAGILSIASAGKLASTSGVIGVSVVSTAYTLGSAGTTVIPNADMSGAASDAARDALAGNIDGAIAIDTGIAGRVYIRDGGAWKYSLFV